MCKALVRYPRSDAPNRRGAADFSNHAAGGYTLAHNPMEIFA